jgi:hypothetical protein
MFVVVDYCYNDFNLLFCGSNIGSLQMRKGSTRHKDTFSLPTRDVEVVYSTPLNLIDDFRESQILDILLRICDACHEIDNRVEPWSSIRKDIEGLR